MNVQECIVEASSIFSSAGIAEPSREARSLLAFALGRETTYLFAHPESRLSQTELSRYRELVRRRESHEPLQYIVGKQEFFALDFKVSPDVLIPRPETELLVETAIKLLKTVDSPRICEVGVGSGCISVALLKNLPAAIVIGLDISAPALEIARANAVIHKVADRLTLHYSDMFSKLEERGFDAIVSNPPYVVVQDFGYLQPEVRDYEPRIALTDGADGLIIIRQLISESPRFLVPGGLLIFEFGFDQVENVKRLLDSKIWRSIEISADLQGIPRTATAILR